jgi:hypothetical protein
LKEEEFFKCDPSDNERPCMIYYRNEKLDDDFKMDDFFTVPCKCSLTGKPNEGYCSSIIGTETYRKAL